MPFPTTVIEPSWWQQRILTWFKKHGRHELPWQEKPDAYNVWLSEIMLQQTQVTTVIPYYHRFIRHFPNLKTLSNAHIDDVLQLWSGLGYYQRARHLLATAQQITLQHNGRFPETIDQLIQLPGIGESTAGAILAMAFHQPATILDGNVKRVLSRVHALEGFPNQSKNTKILWEIAKQYTPKKQVANYTQAMMDLGATRCKRTQPLCDTCPVSEKCQAHLTDRTHELPHPKPKKAKPTRQKQCVILIDTENRILLERRPPVGIWGGLFSLPECPYPCDVVEWCQQQWPHEIIKRTTLPHFTHTFSHFHLEMHPHQLRVIPSKNTLHDSSQSAWYTVEEMTQLGLAAPIKKLLLN